MEIVDEWKEFPFIKGKLYCPKLNKDKKHNCPDCFSCQQCSQSRCSICRKKDYGGKNERKEA